MALLLSFLIYFSCVDEGVEVSRLQTSNQNSDLLAYAKKLVGENGERCSLIDLQKGSTNSRVATDYSTVATPLWEKAKNERHGDEEVLIVPLQSEEDVYSSMYMEKDEMGRLYQTKTFSRLAIRCKNGYTISQILTYLPGRNYAKNRQEVLDTMGLSPLAVKYYGTILISDLDGKFQQGYFYERGIPTIRLKLKKHSCKDASCSFNDTTECDSHEHSHSMNVRLKLSGNITVASRTYDAPDELQGNEICENCNKPQSDCTCGGLEGDEGNDDEEDDGICGDCGWPDEGCVCIFNCSFCGKFECICYPCIWCLSKPCKCEDSGEEDEEPKNEPCEYCHSYYCNGECQEQDPGDDDPEVTIAPKAKQIFNNPSMSENHWVKLERMIEVIDDDCLGEGLFNALKNTLGGETIPVQFTDNSLFRFSSFDFINGITLSTESQSFHLLYEMMHAYHAYTLSGNTLNGEVEALYAQYLYVVRQTGFKNSKWEKIYNSGMILESVKKLENVLDDKGQLLSGKTASDVIQAVNQVVDELHKSFKYSGYIFDSSKNGLENFSNLRTLTTGC